MKIQKILFGLGVGMGFFFTAAAAKSFHEDPEKPKPRKEEYPWMSIQEWYKRHEKNKALAEMGKAKVVFYGDSIVEGLFWSKAFQRFAERYEALALGIGGDRTAQLLWRLRHGEVGHLKPDHVFLLIGINNFGHLNQSPEEVARGVLACAKELRLRFPETILHILAIFPSGEKSTDPLRAKIKEANALIAEGRLKIKHTRFHDLSSIFLDKNGNIPKALMEDFLHPTEKGRELWMRETEKIINKRKRVKKFLFFSDPLHEH